MPLRRQQQRHGNRRRIRIIIMVDPSWLCIFWLLLLLLLLLVSCVTTTRAQSSLGMNSNAVEGSDVHTTYTPYEILQALFVQTGGPSQWKADVAASWQQSLSSNTDYCQYAGITCYDDNDNDIDDTQDNDIDSDRRGHVRSIVLTNVGLQGTTPPELWSLPYLQQVHLDHTTNNNNGNVVTLDTTFLKQAQHLQDLACNVESIIDWTTLPDIADSLRYLSLSSSTTSSSTQTTTPFPTELFRLTQLETLWADHCHFTGQAFSSNPAVGNWQRLQQLNLQDNLLSGALPDAEALAQLTALESLQLGGSNQFTGPLPLQALSAWTNLKFLDLSRTPPTTSTTNDDRPEGLMGPVPSLHTMPSLTHVDFSYQSLTGGLPNNFLFQVPTNQAVTVDLRGNWLSVGHLPPILFTKPRLNLYLADNRIAQPLDNLVPFCGGGGGGGGGESNDNDNTTTTTTTTSTTRNPTSQWLNGNVVDYGNGTDNDCRGFLCPIGTYQPNQGRQSSVDTPCLDCPSNTQYLGQTQCRDAATNNNKDTTAANFDTWSAAQQEDHEYSMLQELLDATHGFHWNQRRGWYDSLAAAFPTNATSTTSSLSSSYCTWYGVTCNPDGRVTELQLSDNGLSGALPFWSIVTSFPYLQVLHLGHNPALQIHWNDDDTDHSSASWPSLSVTAPSLQTLDLSQTDWSHPGSQNTDRFFAQLAVTCPQLQSLKLSANDLTGTTLAELASVSSLQELDLSHNQYSGSLSAFVSSSLPSSLQRLYLQNNQLTSSLPLSSSWPSSLQLLDVSDNDLTGSLPARWGNDGTNSPLQELRLRHNQLTGSIPTTWTSLTSLQTLDVSYNQLQGTLPANLLQGLDAATVKDPNTIQPAVQYEFRFTGNQLTGSIPISLWKNRFVDLFLEITDNQLTTISTTTMTTTDDDDDCPPQWMAGMVVEYGCSAIACPVGTYNPLGRQTDQDEVVDSSDSSSTTTATSLTTCLSCPSSTVLGARSCPERTSTSTNKNKNDLDDVELAKLQVETQKAQELAILQHFFYVTHGDQWKRKDGWLTTANYCTWYGISCDATHHWLVQAIVLPNNGLTGNPTTPLSNGDDTADDNGDDTDTPLLSIWSLSSLAELDLSGNSFTRFSLDGIEQAENLLAVDLSSTRLSSTDSSGSMTSSLSLLQGLEKAKSLLHFSFNDNALSGPFPFAILQMKYKTLRKLSLNGNQLTGPLPASLFSDFSLLQQLYLFRNSLTGNLPTTLGQATQLTYLGLSGNDFTGTIPATALNAMTKLETLAVQGNPHRSKSSSSSSGNYLGLTGPVPTLDQLPNLRQVYLGYHSLMGTIPWQFLAGITDNNAPIMVDLTSNRITGGIPPALARLESMELYLGDNEIDEEIPIGICRQDGWMRGQVGQSSSCNTILCPPQTFESTQGRQQVGDKDSCQPCPAGQTADYYGSLSCLSLSAQTERKQRRVLEELYYSTGGGEGHWVQDLNWLHPDVPICEWHGISCSNDATTTTVQAIQLIHNGLRGVIPTSVLTQLPQLLELDVSFNPYLGGFEFSRPSSSTTSTSTSSSSSSLSSPVALLTLDNIGLTTLAGMGTVVQFPQLEQLRLTGNDFGNNNKKNDNIFDVLNQLPSLLVLYLSHNDIGTLFPNTTTTSNLNLVGFECQNCNLQGPISPLIGSWVELEYLNLADNHLAGEFPTLLNSLTKLKALDLSDQATGSSVGLSGPLPSLANSPHLREVYLQNNGFEGAIPTNFLNAVVDGAVTIDLRYNVLTGTIPGNLSRFTADSYFYAAGNSLTGMDESLCSLNWNDRANMTSGSSGTTTTNECDHILCGVGEFNGLGRATPSLPCQPCTNDNNDNTNTTNNLIGRTFCLEGEKEVLQELFRALNGKVWKNRQGWENNNGDNHDDVCTWYGVTCHGEDTLAPGTIRALDLSDNGLQGTLPTSIWSLTELMHLDLSSSPSPSSSQANDYINNIVVESIGTTTTSTTVSSLEDLNLSGNTVPSLAGIGAFAKTLVTFSCTSCSIAGPLPDELFTLDGLEKLFLNFNRITGELSSELGQWTNLKELHMRWNDFNGTLPDELTLLSSLEVIDLGHNDFYGALPYNISFMPKLRFLAMDQERVPFNPNLAFFPGASGITGNLPPFHQNPELRELYLSQNHLDGTIPPNFLDGVKDKSATIVVNLESNSIHRKVPANLAQFDDLRIYLGNNRIDSVAPEVCEKWDWMDGLLATGCDALLCPMGTYNEYGRRTLTEKCKRCDHNTMTNLHMGSMGCLAVTIDRDDRSMLVELYDHTDGESWTNNQNWKSSTSICKWFGVTCADNDGSNEERVTELVLPSNNLVGDMRSIVFYLPHLRKLDLSGNRIRSTFRDLKDADVLESLNMAGIFFIDLEGLGKATNLKELKLNDNMFFGRPFPTDIYSMTDLRVLDVGNAAFAGSFSSTGLQQLSNLQTFNASFNLMEGEIPDVFKNHTALQVVDISNNQFHGTIPKSLQFVSTLRYLDVSGQNKKISTTGLSGPLLPFVNSPLLVHLDVRSNSLTGTIPSDVLANIENPSTQKVTLLLGSNMLHGDVPAEVGDRFGNLNIDLVDNEIESLPDNLCSANEFGCDGLLCPTGEFNADGRQTSAENPCKVCPGDYRGVMGQSHCPSVEKARNKQILEKLYEKTGGANWGNRDGWFTNPDICTWYGITCRDDAFVDTINLGANNLVNTPPTEIFNLGGLRRLILFSNPIEFSFEGIENAADLERLELGSTHLKSLDGVGKAPALKYLDVSSIGLLGGFPHEEIDQLAHLEHLQISDNKFNSQLPSFGNNRNLIILLASGNAFAGPLPSFDVHPEIKRIDVHQNQLIGTIPSNFLEIADTSNPIMLYLSENNLGGIIPGSLSRFSDMTLWAQGNRFTGIDPELCEMDDWNDGNVGLFECNGILCPPETFSPKQGRASSKGECEPCSNAPFFGHTICGGDGEDSNVDGASAAISVRGLAMSLLWMFPIIATCCLTMLL